MTVVGLGAQDSLPEAKEFVERHGTRSFRMLWDPSLESWQKMKVFDQPVFVLLSREGAEIKRWQRGFPTDEILKLAT